MKSGENCFLKDNLVLDETEIKTADWYQAALADKNMVQVGCYDQQITQSRYGSHPFSIVVAVSPRVDMDKSERIEMITLHMNSGVTKRILNYHKQKTLGETIILDEKNDVLLDLAGIYDQLPADFDVASYTQNDFYNYIHTPMGKKACFVYSEPVSGWKIVTLVDNTTLMKSFNRVAVAILLLTVGILALFYMFSSYFLRNILEPVNKLVLGMAQVEEGRLDVQLTASGQSEIRHMTNSFNHMVVQLKELNIQNEREQQLKHEAEIKALQSQINPHFLVNTLSSIQFMAQVAKFDGIKNMAEALIKILSCSFRSNISFYTVAEEIAVLKSYVYLMKIRYSDGFDVIYDIDDRVLDVKLPRLILQPFVENAIVHGFGDMEDVGEILVKLADAGDFIEITIKDNGRGMTQAQIEEILSGRERGQDDNYNIGINNVLSRLRLNYNDQCTLGITSVIGDFTSVVLKIPKNVRGGEQDV